MAYFLYKRMFQNSNGSMKKEETLKNIIKTTAIFGIILGTVKFAAKRMSERECASGEKLCTEVKRNSSDRQDKRTAYESIFKPLMDTLLSFTGLIILSPIFLFISIVVYIDDPGPILFTQERIGKNKKLFRLHKFRSMKMSTPHDVPTHQLENPEQYITKVGKILRKYSLDELPQIWDIFRGKMSIIGPRPALWNQDDLVAERDRYRANDILPGLTGWAQINGRDELEIEDKARLDGEYVKKLRQGGMKALFFDVKCFLDTIFSVIESDGVVEGGTGELYRTEKEDAGFAEYGHLKHFHIDLSEKNKKKVLITGAGSYIGESFEQWANAHYAINFVIDTLDMQNPDWRVKDFSSYDVVFHVAGIAHADVGKVSEKEKKKYYAVNTDLAIETAEKAKEEGVGQFILMSSMIIYGNSAPYGKEKVIDERTMPAPENFYGDSKWQADRRVRALGDENFRVAVLRPPMIYGRGSKGNYPVLAKLAKRLPIFPDVENRRSMLYIDNLCEFLCKLMLSGENGVYFPQNGEYTKTSSMVRIIGKVTQKPVRISQVFNPIVGIAFHIPGKLRSLAEKAFSSSYYDQKLSRYDGLDYQKVSLCESIERSEKSDGEKKALMIASVASMIDLFNADNIIILEELGHKIDVAANFSFGSITSQERVEEYKQELIDRGIGVYNIPIPRSLSMINEIRVSYRMIKRLVDTNHYNIVHCHSPIGGVLCRMACRKARKSGTKVIYTAHGFHFFEGASKRAWMLYYPVEKFCSRFTDIIITINHEDYKAAKSFHNCQVKYVPGIGIHVDEIKNIVVDREKMRAELGYKDSDFVFMSTGQVSIRKNHEVVIRAMALLADSKIKYLIVGFGEEENRLKELVKSLGLECQVTFAGYRSDVIELLHCVDGFVFPSMQEGLPVAMMEAMAVGLPIVCSRIRGNVDLITDGEGGYLVEYDKPEAFASSMSKVVNLDNSYMKTENQRKITSFDNRKVKSAMKSIYISEE